MASEGKVFTFEEVAKHNHKKDCWIIINAKVYDVTHFLDDHPGGDEVLLLAAEKDATNDFEEVGHSLSARETMEKFYIGEIDVSTIPPEPDYRIPPPPRAPTVASEDSGFGVKILQYLIPLLLLCCIFPTVFQEAYFTHSRKLKLIYCCSLKINQLSVFALLLFFSVTHSICHHTLLQIASSPCLNDEAEGTELDEAA